jgi:hypothetical protein
MNPSEDLQMWNPTASIVGCCLAALPLIGCAERSAALYPEQPPARTAAYVASPAAGTYTTRRASPSAILVFVPATQTVGSDDLLTRDPSLWAAQGFDVVMPDIAQLIADRQAALERLVVSARRLADAPIWLVGPGPAIEAAMPELAPGQVSGVVVTSVSSGAGRCSRTIFYSNPGTGAEPRVTVKTSGDACGAPSPIGERPAPSGVTPVPRVRPGAPRIIEASIPAHASPAAQRPLIHHVAEEIKGLPSS